MREINEDSWKYWILRIGLILSLGILVVTVFKLAIIQKDYYQKMAINNKVVEMTIPAARVKILDRKGRLVATSIYQYYKVEGNDKIYQSSGNFDGGKLEGKNEVAEVKRFYPYGESMAFVTGYVGKANGDDIKNSRCGWDLRESEWVGRGGVESFLDCQIRGKDGRRLVEVDARGTYIRELGREEPQTTSDLNLSVDAYWQDKIYKMLGGKKAVVIISEPKTGKIISLVSSPGFDPNVFSYNQNDEKIKEYLDDRQNFPMLNRAVAARYEPGSVFKIVMSTAGLESGVINLDSKYEDTGIIKVGDYSYSNWQWSRSGVANGLINIVTAIQKSNDIFFYKLGGDLGLDRIKIWMDKYGFGKKTGVELAGELDGIAPNESWKKETKGENWFLGDTYHLSIGQGDLSVTPLQINQMTNIMANHGVKCKMSILRDIKPECQDLKLKSDTWETIITGMKEACKPGGTAWPLYNFKTQIACKTGTAEVGDGSNDTHAWLTAFAPADDPQISITVMVERGGEGSDTAAPIVGDILKEWFGEPNTVVPRYSDQKGKSE